MAALIIPQSTTFGGMTNRMVNDPTSIDIADVEIWQTKVFTPLGKTQAVEAKKQTLAALEIAPTYERAQELLLKLADARRCALSACGRRRFPVTRGAHVRLTTWLPKSRKRSNTSRR